MTDMNREAIEQLSAIISDYRKCDISISLDDNHVIKWIRQFSESRQDTILLETLNIFSEWYFDNAKINAFLAEVYGYVLKHYGQALKDVCFANCQLEGKSQILLLEALSNLVAPESVNMTFSNSKHLIYIDDGLYSGQHIIKDIKNLLLSEAGKTIETIDVFVLLAYSDGLSYVRNELERVCIEQGIGFTLYRWKELSNTKAVQFFDSEEEYCTNQDVLWPINPRSDNLSDVKARVESLSGRKVHYCYRESSRQYQSRVFSSEQSRRIVEEEFLEKGNAILSDESFRKGIYPLGFSSFPSLGFGSFCATRFNISNTCPIVLWWGNLEKQGNALDSWYPLLPRRVNI